MLNNLTPILFISGFISLLSFIPIHTTVKKLVTCFCETVWLIDTMSLGLSILAIYLIFYLTRGVLVFFTKSVKNTWNEIKDYYVKIYMDVYYPTAKNATQITENENLISYSYSIELIKKSAYGKLIKSEAIKNGLLKETGGKYITETSFIGVLRSNESKKYIPTTEESLELAKELMLYDQIFQEYAVGYGYYNNNFQLKHESIYHKNVIKIKHLDLEEFLRVKELELQQRFLPLTSKHIA